MDPKPALYLDENMEVELAARLRASGFDVLTARGAGRLSKSDLEQLRFAAENGRAVVTHDMHDYGLLARDWDAQKLHHCGIILAPLKSAAYLERTLIELLAPYASPADIQDVTLRIS